MHAVTEDVPKQKHRRSNNDQRSRAKNVVRVWFGDRVDNQQNRYSAVDGKPVVIAQEYNARERRDAVPKTKRRPTGAFDREGKPIMEIVAIADTLTATGTATRPALTGGNFPGGPSSGFEGSQSRYQHDEHLAHVKRCMAHVLVVCAEYHSALEMDAAGYPPEAITGELGCRRDMARAYVDEGIAVLCSLLLQRFKKVDE